MQEAIRQKDDREDDRHKLPDFIKDNSPVNSNEVGIKNINNWYIRHYTNSGSKDEPKFNIIRSALALALEKDKEKEKEKEKTSSSRICNPRLTKGFASHFENLNVQLNHSHSGFF